MGLVRRGDKSLAEKEWKMVSKADRKRLNLNKSSFKREFLQELKHIRKKRLRKKRR